MEASTSAFSLVCHVIKDQFLLFMGGLPCGHCVKIGAGSWKIGRAPSLACRSGWIWWCQILLRSVQCNVDCRRFKFVSSVRSSSVYPCLLHVHTQQATIPIFSNSSKIPHVLYFWKAGDSRNSIMIIISSYQFDGAHRRPVDAIFNNKLIPAIIILLGKNKKFQKNKKNHLGSFPAVC